MDKQLKQQDATKDISIEVINAYLDGLGNNLSPKHKNQFIQIAQTFNLNPFTKEIYGIPYGNNFNIIVGYEVYLKRAERSGKLAGWEVKTHKDGTDIIATCTISRKDWEKPLIHEVSLSEYKQNTTIWNQKPKTMIKKVAIAQSFRLAFPVELGGMPYMAEELPTLENKGFIQQEQVIEPTRDWQQEIKQAKTSNDIRAIYKLLPEEFHIMAKLKAEELIEQEQGKSNQLN